MNKNILPNFLQEQDGTCLSIYLPSIESSHPLSNQAYLSQVKSEVNELLRWNYAPDTRKYFLRMIEKLTEDPNYYQNPKNNLALFINENGIWDLQFSGYCKPFFSLANSFHIKPLLRYFHRNRRFFIVNFETEKVNLYIDGPDQLKLIDSVPYSESVKKDLSSLTFAFGKKRRRISERLDRFTEWVSDWVMYDLRDENSPLIVAGIKPLASRMKRISGYTHTVRKGANLYGTLSVDQLQAKSKLQIDSLIDLYETKIVGEYRRRRGLGEAASDLRSVAKAAVGDRIQTLLISRDDHIWGELNRYTGDFTTHGIQLTDLDDDLLDDCAEVAIANGARVYVLEQSQMPDNLPIVAILKPELLQIEKREERPFVSLTS